ncbi:MAG: glycoside hydrolase family 3 C-terminal domain-containing protein [Bacteroidota bacterium]
MELNIKNIIFGFIILLTLTQCNSITKDKNLSNKEIEGKSQELLKQMTLEEKVLLLGGKDGEHTNEIPRLGIPSLSLINGPHGVGGTKGTTFPAGVAMASTWNEKLINEVGIAIGKEALAKKADILLGPTINIHRNPIAGRNFESYSEDPYLTTRMGLNFVKGVQSLRVATSLKHFALNNQELSRSTFNAELDERTLREIYLPAFETIVKEAQPMTIMAAYNRFRGENCTENKYLLNDILRNEWGFEGFVMSDWDATHSTVKAAKAGLDLEMPGKPKFFNKKLIEAVEDGKLSEKEIDEKVINILNVYYRMGVFDDQNSLPQGELDTPEHRKLAGRVAREAIVLLKNDNNLLPLNKDNIDTIAVIGPNANVNLEGGGGSSEVKPFYSISPLEGLKNNLGEDVVLLYNEGTDISLKEMPEVESKYLMPPNAKPGEHGLKAEFFNNEHVAGKPVVTRIDKKIDFDWGQKSPDVKIQVDRFSVRWTGKLIGPKTGRIEIGVHSNDGSYLYIDNKLVVNNWGMHGPHTKSVIIDVEKGKEYDIKVEFVEMGNNAKVALRWQLELENPTYDKGAVEFAKKADLAIVYAGLSKKHESEGYDRGSMDMPGAQDELIRAVAKVNKNIIVVINSGTPVSMDKWIDNTSAVLQAWYLGQETGNAIADVLFGDVNPSGKLPVTLPKRYEDNPAYPYYGKRRDTAQFGEGLFIGYRYYDSKNVEPLFPFGFGLSYTTFEYKDLKINQVEDGNVQVNLLVKNTGKIEGKEIIQLYVHDVQSSVERPVKELKGFSKVTLKPGETKTVTMQLDQRAFSFYDIEKKKWVAEPGEFEILIGSSSRGIKLKSKFKLE